MTLFNDDPRATWRGMMIIKAGMHRDTALKFPYNPVSVDIDGKANYTDHAVFGRASPISHFTHGSVKTISFDLEVEAKSDTIYMQKIGVLYPDKEGNLRQPVRDRSLPIGQIQGDKKVMQVYNFLDSLRYPRNLVQNPGRIGPPPFLLILSENLRHRCIMRSVKVQWTEFAPQQPDSTNNPLRGTISLEMTVAEPEATHEDILIGAPSKEEVETQDTFDVVEAPDPEDIPLQGKSTLPGSGLEFG